MMEKTLKGKNGFTLIELLVVISIIGLLASIILAATNASVVKAKDARKKSDVRQVMNALTLYYDKTGTMPPNYTTNGRPAYEGSTEYDSTFQLLINAGVIGSIPRSPDGTSYGYYNYGPNTPQGAVFFAQLSNDPGIVPGAPDTPLCQSISSGTGLCYDSFGRLKGDADSNGTVNASDYFRIDSCYLNQPNCPSQTNYGGVVTPAGINWANGDFDGNNKINASDYFIIDWAYLAHCSASQQNLPTNYMFCKNITY